MSQTDRRSDPLMVFVVGAGRSGTTLLRLMLDAHSKVYSGPEDQLALVHLLRWHRVDPSAARFVAELFRFQTANGPLAELWGIHECRSELQSRLDQVSQTGDDSFAAKVDVVRELVLRECAPGATIWCIKTPNYALFPWVIEEAAVSSAVIHLVRDGRDVATSYLQGHLRWHVDPPTVARAAQIWRQSNRSARSLEKVEQSRYVRLRYEDLVKQPAVSISKLCSVIGIEREDQMLTPHQGNQDLSKIPPNEHGWHVATARPINSASVGRGLGSMTERELRVFAAVAGDELKRLGYPLVVAESGQLNRLWVSALTFLKGGWRSNWQELRSRVRWWRRAREQRVS